MTPELPTFGVPKGITAREGVFVVTAGVPLSIVVFSLFAGMAVALNLDFDTHPWLGVFVIPLLGVGPAVAYYLARWLQSRRVPLLLGCAALAGWVFLLPFVALFGGWAGFLGLCAATGAVMWRWRRPDVLAP